MAESVYRANRPEVIDEQFDDEYVVVNLKTGIYYSLNSTAARYWEALNRFGSRSAILASLNQTFDTSPEIVSEHFDQLAGEMLREELILLAPENSGATPELTEPQATERLAFAPPRLEKYNDMQALLLLDPIHQVDASGWPATKPDVG